MKKALIGLMLAVGLMSTAHAQSRFLMEGVEDNLYRDGVTTYTNNNGLVALSWITLRNKADPTNLSRSLVQVQCNSRMVRFVRSVNYVNNRLVFDSGENWYAPWQNPIPDSLMMDLQQLCYSR